MLLRNSLLLFTASALSLTTISAQASCGADFCTLNTNWNAQGIWGEPGLRLDMRYEYIAQDEMLRGKNALDPALAHHREKETQNRNLQTTLDYNFNETYGLTVTLPVVSREHIHYHKNHLDKTQLDVEAWDFTKVGDVKIISRLQLSQATQMLSTYGFNLGVKLPTGDYEVKNTKGKLAERSLQPGTGTTDGIVGVYFRQELPAMTSQWFAQAQYTTPFAARDQYKSGAQTSVDLGLRYSASPKLQALLQVNYSNKAKDSGENAEPQDTGGRFVYLSPGISYRVTFNLQIYSFVHHRLSQQVNGNQLGSRDNVVAGVNVQF